MSQASAKIARASRFTRPSKQCGWRYLRIVRLDSNLGQSNFMTVVGKKKCRNGGRVSSLLMVGSATQMGPSKWISQMASHSTRHSSKQPHWEWRPDVCILSEKRLGVYVCAPCHVVQVCKMILSRQNDGGWKMTRSCITLTQLCAKRQLNFAEQKKKFLLTKQATRFHTHFSNQIVHLNHYFYRQVCPSFRPSVR